MEFMNLLLLLLEHGNRCVAVVKKTQDIKKGARPAIRSQFTIQKLTSVKPHTVKPKLHKNIPMSYHNLLEWCRYLEIPITDLLSRDQTVLHNHRQALFIYILGPSYMSGSHWVATYVKDGVINFFDSFGMNASVSTRW